MKKMLLCIGICSISLVTMRVMAQPPQPKTLVDESGPKGERAEDFDFSEFGPPPGHFGPGQREPIKLVKKFDRNDDGWLNREERVAARKSAKSNAQQGPRRGGPPGGPRGDTQPESPQPGRRLSPADVEQFTKADLYDPSVMRTLFLEFENQDWEQELEDFHDSDVEVPATLTVDGQTLPLVGVRFRGMSSYGMVPSGLKRSFNIGLDLVNESQRLYGYKTLNLLNCAGDPSFMSTVLYSRIANEYLPAPKANHVRVVINGECWGVYVNVQQFDKLFLAEHFESTTGTRWKVKGSPNGDGGLRYLGDDLKEYKQRFDMKSNDGTKAWNALVKLCRTLNETPLDQLQHELEPMLDIDATLRFLALDVALVNSDGYWTRASDYSLFLDSNHRFHVFPHDMNEAFVTSSGPPGFGRRPGGRGGFGPPPGGPAGFGPPPRGPGGFGPPPRGPGGFGPPGRGPGGPGGPNHGGIDLEPLVGIENSRMPLRSRLLQVPELRTRYLDYIREIAEHSLDWQELQSFVSQQTKLIENEVSLDTRKLYTLEDFERATSTNEANEKSLRRFFEQRRSFLLKDQASAVTDKAQD